MFEPEMIPPSKYYRGPVTGIMVPLDEYKYPCTAEYHCASCGSTDVSRPSSGKHGKVFRCNRCGRRTYAAYGPDWLGNIRYYDILVKGHTVRESLTYAKSKEALWEVLTSLDTHCLSEKASEYFGDYYDNSSAEDRNILEMYLPYANDWISYGYVHGLEVGETYNLPDFPVSVVCVKEGGPVYTPKSAAGKPAKPKASSNRRTTSTGRTASKPKASKNVKKTPAKKTTKPKTRASARSASRRY